MRVEDIYGEDSPEPTKRNDTPRQKKEKSQQEEVEEVKSGIWKFIFLTLLASFIVGFMRGMGGTSDCTIPKKVY